MTLIQQWAVAGGEENYTTNTKYKEKWKMKTLN